MVLTRYLLRGFCWSLRLSQLLKFHLQLLMRVEIFLLDLCQQNLFALKCSHGGGRSLQGQIRKIVLSDVWSLFGCQVLIGDSAICLIRWTLCNASQSYKMMNQSTYRLLFISFCLTWSLTVTRLPSVLALVIVFFTPNIAMLLAAMFWFWMTSLRCRVVVEIVIVRLLLFTVWPCDSIIPISLRGLANFYTSKEYFALINIVQLSDTSAVFNKYLRKPLKAKLLQLLLSFSLLIDNTVKLKK